MGGCYDACYRLRQAHPVPSAKLDANLGVNRDANPCAGRNTITLARLLAHGWLENLYPGAAGDGLGAVGPDV